MAYQYDAKLVSIDQPAQKICASGISPVVTIKTTGCRRSTSLSITFRLTAKPCRHNRGQARWPLCDHGGQPNFTHIAEGSHRLQVYTRLPNQQADELPANDTAAKTFIYSALVDNIAEGSLVRITPSLPPTGMWSIPTAEPPGSVTPVSAGREALQPE